MIKYSDIKQFRDIIADVKHWYRYEGMDDDGVPLYNDKLLPELEFTGTVKLHGTNAGVMVTNSDDVIFQSRNKVLSSGDGDNYGFYAFANLKRDFFVEFSKLFKFERDVIFFGEWAGCGIASGVGINRLDKAFYLFDILIDGYYWVSDDEIRHAFTHMVKRLVDDSWIFCVLDFKTYRIKIDFNDPALVADEINDIVNTVSGQCPVAFAQGIHGVGEGIVFSHWEDGKKYRFKVKGLDFHSSKQKKVVEIAPVTIHAIEEFIDYAVTENRLNQMLGVLLSEVGSDAIDMSNFGKFLKLVNQDIIKEESDVLSANGLVFKDVSSRVVNVAKQFYLNFMGV